jgi:hypothetical protein
MRFERALPLILSRTPSAFCSPSLRRQHQDADRSDHSSAGIGVRSDWTYRIRCSGMDARILKKKLPK